MTREIIHNMPDADYRKAHGLAQSSLKKVDPALKGNPDEFCRDRDEPHAQSATFAFGSASHSLLLEPDTFDARWVRGPDNRRGNVWASAVVAAEMRGTQVLPSGEYDEVLRLRDRVLAHPTARLALERATARELAMFAPLGEDDTQRQCKGKADAVDTNEHIIIDLKTCENADPVLWQRVTLDWGYHIQAAWYSDLYEAATGHRPTFVIIAAEKSPRRGVSVIHYPTNWIEAGRRQYLSDMRILSRCESSGDWSAYGWQIHTLGSDGWIEKKLREVQ